MPVLDPTQVVLPWQENTKAMVIGYGGAILNLCALHHYVWAPDSAFGPCCGFLVSAAAFGALGFAWPAIWKYLPGATQATFKPLPSGAPQKPPTQIE